ncbi:MAG: hypothetical protein JSU79_08300 [Dehalococcoidales bacterium]|nr:MAG: hypothetical protein JSU79_08300 [Dehalococcoidales bacterium]
MFKKILHWSLFIAAIILLISGFGIVYFRVVETITFGLFTKPLAFKIHTITWIPFLILLGMHVMLTSRKKWFNFSRNNR